MTPTQPDRPAVRRVPVALYIATSGATAAVPLTRHARAFAEARDWTVTLTIVDDDPTRPLDQRPGRQVIADALSARTIDGVVTWTHDMVTGARAVRGTQARDQLPRVLGDGGGFLAAAVPDSCGGHPTGSRRVRPPVHHAVAQEEAHRGRGAATSYPSDSYNGLPSFEAVRVAGRSARWARAPSMTARPTPRDRKAEEVAIQ